MKKPVESAKFNNLITILTRSTMRSAGGGRESTWTTFKTLFASISTKAATPQREGGVLEFTDMTVFTIRYTESILTLRKQDMRIRFNDNYYFINSIIDMDFGRRYVELICIREEKAEVDD